MRYKFIAIDIDGTLIGPDQVVAADVCLAIAAAEDAGLRVCLATGRSYAETMPIWRQLPLRRWHEPLVLIGGALVSEPATGRTLSHIPIPHEHACAYSDALVAEGYSAMAIVDRWRCGVDYYFVPAADEQSARERWFRQMSATVRRVDRLAQAPDMPPALRIHATVDDAKAPSLAQRLIERFDGTMNIHAILAPNYGVTIVEAFAAAADKWAGIQYVAQAYRIGPGQIVAVGDDVNDVPMLQAAGLGVAVPGAKPRALAAAKVVAADGLAPFIHQLIAGKFDL